MRLRNLISWTLSISILITFLGYLPSEAYAIEKVSYVHSDHLGSTSLITDKDGNVIDQKVYYPYGSTRQETGLTTTTERKYTGQASDQDQTGLYYYNARYYHQTISKFTQADTSTGPNRYAYVGNNPLKHIDPSGNESENTWQNWWTQPSGSGGSDSQSSGGLTAKVVESQLFQGWLSQGAPMLGNTEAMSGFNFSQAEDRQAAMPLAAASIAAPLAFLGGAAVAASPALVAKALTVAGVGQTAVDFGTCVAQPGSEACFTAMNDPTHFSGLDDFIDSGVNLMRSGRYRQAIEHFRSSTARNIAEAADLHLSTDSNVFFGTPSFQDESYLVSRAGWKSEFSIDSRTIRVFDISLYNPATQKELVSESLDQELGLMHTEEWLHALQEIRGGSLAGIDDFEADVARFLHLSGVGLTPGFIRRYPGRADAITIAN